MSNDPKEPLLLDHEYDGIQELDNNLPRWWVWLFYLTIIFSAVYMVYYHVARVGDLQVAEYQKEMKAGDALKAGAMSAFESSLASLQPLKDNAALDAGHLPAATQSGKRHGPNHCVQPRSVPTACVHEDVHALKAISRL